jgi:hypothetical protein
MAGFHVLGKRIYRKLLCACADQLHSNPNVIAIVCSLVRPLTFPRLVIAHKERREHSSKKECSCRKECH